MIYEYLWRNKWLTSDAVTIDDMINCLQSNVDLLREMKADGVILDPESGIGDDYAGLITANKAVAEKYDFNEPFYEDEDEDE